MAASTALAPSLSIAQEGATFQKQHDLHVWHEAPIRSIHAARPCKKHSPPPLLTLNIKMLTSCNANVRVLQVVYLAKICTRRRPRCVRLVDSPATSAVLLPPPRTRSIASKLQCLQKGSAKQQYAQRGEIRATLFFELPLFSWSGNVWKNLRGRVWRLQAPF